MLCTSSHFSPPKIVEIDFSLSTLYDLSGVILPISLPARPVIPPGGARCKVKSPFGLINQVPERSWAAAEFAQNPNAAIVSQCRMCRRISSPCPRAVSRLYSEPNRSSVHNPYPECPSWSISKASQRQGFGRQSREKFVTKGRRAEGCRPRSGKPCVLSSPVARRDYAGCRWSRIAPASGRPAAQPAARR